MDKIKEKEISSLLQEVVKIGGSVGKKLERDIRQFEQSGMISNWLAGESLISQASFNSAQQSAFIKKTTPTVTINQPIRLDPARTKSLNKKPEVSDTSSGKFTLLHPWQIKTRPIPNTDPVQYEFKVELNSNLYSNINSFSSITINNLNKWIKASQSNEYVFLIGDIEDGVCTNAYIEQKSSNQRISFANDDQTEFSTKIGYLFYENASINVRQEAFHNFTLMQSCVNGIPALYPFAT